MRKVNPRKMAEKVEMCRNDVHECALRLHLNVSQNKLNK